MTNIFPRVPPEKPGPNDRLKAAREQHGWRQQDVAEQIGVSPNEVGRWERNGVIPHGFNREKLRALFGMSDAELGLLPHEQDAPPGPHPIRPGLLYDMAIPPRPAVSLVGRETILRQIKQRLCASRSVVIHGLPGVGKTALAITLAHDKEVRASFQDGILWAGLGPTPNYTELLGRWGELLGMASSEIASFRGHEAWAEALRSAIGSRRFLLILDDVWQLETAVTLSVDGHPCTYLLTTRSSEIAAHLSLEEPLWLHELGKQDSISLLRRLVPDIVSRESQRVTDLVEVVGGLPLALVLMGNYLRKQSYSRQPRRVQAALERLNNAEERLHLSEPQSLCAPHPGLSQKTPVSLYSVIALTDQQLSAPARTALYCLAVFPPKPKSFSEAAALAVVGGEVQTLDSLVDAGLLGSSGSGRYTLHQVIADYAHLHLTDDLAICAYERLLDYFAGYIQEHLHDHERLAQDRTLILAAWEAAFLRRMHTVLARYVDTFAAFFLLDDFSSWAEHYVRQIRVRSREQDEDVSLMHLLQALSGQASRQGKPAQAKASIQQRTG